MVAELLRLKLRLLVNAFRSPRAVVWAVIGFVLAAVLVAALWVGASLAAHLDATTLRRVVVIVGAMVSLAAFFLPVLVVRSHLIHPQTLRLFAMRPLGIIAAMLFTTLVGPVLLLIPVALVPVQLWDGSARDVAWGAVPLIVLEGILAARLGALVGARLRRMPVLSGIARLLAGLLLLGGIAVIVAHVAPAVAELLPGKWWRSVLPVVLLLAPLRHPAIADTITTLPVGAFWRMPAHAEMGEWALVRQDLALGVAAIVVLFVLWASSVRFMLRATRRVPRERVARVPGWFRRFAPTPTGAVAARSFTYWARDPRYRTALVVLPLIPVVMLLSMWIAGIPWELAVLLPLPAVVLLIGWSTLHNDVAYDSTAVWVHVSAGIRGVDDRIGRMLPVLAIGVPVVLGGSVLVAWLHGDWSILPALLGVCSALLLGGIGVSSISSATAPYPATRPGDAPFQQPQVPGSSGGGTQSGSLIAILLVASPAIAAAVLYLLGGDTFWSWTALVAGVAAGGVMLVAGLRGGGLAFDRRAPELLAFTTRH